MPTIPVPTSSRRTSPAIEPAFPAALPSGTSFGTNRRTGARSSTDANSRPPSGPAPPAVTTSASASADASLRADHGSGPTSGRLASASRPIDPCAPIPRPRDVPWSFPSAQRRAAPPRSEIVTQVPTACPAVGAAVQAAQPTPWTPRRGTSRTDHRWIARGSRSPGRRRTGNVPGGRVSCPDDDRVCYVLLPSGHARERKR